MGKMIRETGTKDGKCANCNADLKEHPPTFFGHGDGAKGYCYMFTCSCCNNMIVQHFKRDREWW